MPAETREYADKVATTLVELGHDDITYVDLLDAMAISGVTLVLDHEMLSSKTYIEVLQVNLGLAES